MKLTTTIFWVEQHKNAWRIIDSRHVNSYDGFCLRKDAIRIARSRAKAAAPSILRVRKLDGTIGLESSYGLKKTGRDSD